MSVVIFYFWCLTHIITSRCNEDDNNNLASIDLIQTYSLSSLDTSDILEAHNAVRRKENATDMQYMVIKIKKMKLSMVS